MEVDEIDNDPWTGSPVNRTRLLRKKTVDRQGYMRHRERDGGWHTVVSPSARPDGKSATSKKEKHRQGKEKGKKKKESPEKKFARLLKRSSTNRLKSFEEFYTEQRLKEERKANQVEEEEYLPRQKAEVIWRNFDPKIESKRTLRATNLLRRQSLDILGDEYEHALERNHEKDAFYKAALSPAPRAEVEGAKPVHLQFRPMLNELFQNDRSSNRELLKEMEVPHSPVHERKRPWSRPLTPTEIDTITTHDFDDYNKKMAMQANVDFPDKISTKAYEADKGMVKLLMAEEVRAAKQMQSKEIYRQHKERLKELKLSAKDRAKLLADNLRRETVEKAKQAREALQAEQAMLEAEKQKRAPPTASIMIGREHDKPIYGFRKIESVDNALNDSTFKDQVSYLELVERCAKIREEREDNLSAMTRANNNFVEMDTAWEDVRRNPKYLLGRRFEIMKQEADTAVAVAEANMVFSNIFVMNDEDRRRWKRLRNKTGRRASRAVAEEARRAVKQAEENMRRLRMSHHSKKKK